MGSVYFETSNSKNLKNPHKTFTCLTPWPIEVVHPFRESFDAYIPLYFGLQRLYVTFADFVLAINVLRFVLARSLSRSQDLMLTELAQLPFGLWCHTRPGRCNFPCPSLRFGGVDLGWDLIQTEQKGSHN